MSAISGLETFYIQRMINDYIYLQYGRIINVMKICLISAYNGRISRVRVLSGPHLTMASLIPLQLFPVMVNLYKGIRIQEDKPRRHTSASHNTITITFPTIRGAEANKTIIVSNRRGARLHMSECFRMSNKNCCKYPSKQINYSIMKEQFYCPHEKVQQLQQAPFKSRFDASRGNVRKCKETRVR